MPQTFTTSTAVAKAFLYKKEDGDYEIHTTDGRKVYFMNEIATVKLDGLAKEIKDQAQVALNSGNPSPMLEVIDIR